MKALPLSTAAIEVEFQIVSGDKPDTNHCIDDEPRSQSILGCMIGLQKISNTGEFVPCIIILKVAIFPMVDPREVVQKTIIITMVIDHVDVLHYKNDVLVLQR